MMNGRICGAPLGDWTNVCGATLSDLANGSCVDVLETNVVSLHVLSTGLVL